MLYLGIYLYDASTISYLTMIKLPPAYCQYDSYPVFYTHADGSGEGRVFAAVCLCVSLFLHTISQKPMQL